MKTPLPLFTLMVVAMLFFLPNQACAAAMEDEEKPLELQISGALNDALESIGGFFSKSFLLIIPDTQGELLLGRTTDFSSDSTRFLEEKRTGIGQLNREVVRQAAQDMESSYHLFVLAQANVDYKYLFKAVEQYQRGLTLLPQHNNLGLHLTLLKPFKKLDDLKGFKNTDQVMEGKYP